MSGAHFGIDLTFRPLDDDAADLKNGLEADVLQSIPQTVIAQDKLDRPERIAKNDKFLHPANKIEKTNFLNYFILLRDNCEPHKNMKNSEFNGCFTIRRAPYFVIETISLLIIINLNLTEKIDLRCFNFEQLQKEGSFRVRKFD